MAEVVFSHSTALDVFRWRPDLLRRSRIPLSAEISPAPPPLEDARMLLREIMLQSTEVSSNALSGGFGGRVVCRTVPASVDSANPLHDGGEVDAVFAVRHSCALGCAGFWGECIHSGRRRSLCGVP